MKTYTHIIWDFNGTLVNDGWLGVEINNQMNQKRGMPPITPDFYYDNFTHPPKDFYSKVGYTFDKESYDEVSKEFIKLYIENQHQVTLADGIQEALDTFQNAGLEQMIISAHAQSLLVHHVESLGISAYFRYIIGSDNHVVVGKVQRALDFAKEEGINLSGAIFIGDTAHDVETAQALGCDCVLIARGHQSEKALREQVQNIPIFSDVSSSVTYIMQRVKPQAKSV